MAETLADLISAVVGNGYRSPVANSIARTRPDMRAAKQYELAQAVAASGPAALQGNAQDQQSAAYAPQPGGRYIGSDIAEASGLPSLRRGIQHVANAVQMPTLDQPDELGAALPELVQGGMGAMALIPGVAAEGSLARELPARRTSTPQFPDAFLPFDENLPPGVRPAQPFSNSFRGGTADLNEAAAMRPNASAPDAGGAAGESMPLSALEHFDPIDGFRPWELRGASMEDETVRTALANGRLRNEPFNDAPNWTGQDHAERIASLMHSGWQDPITLGRGADGEPYMIDGYHRLAAARLRGDSDIAVRYGSAFDPLPSRTPATPDGGASAGGQWERAFHGTASDIVGAIRPSEMGDLGPGVYVSRGPETAGHYASNRAGWRLVDGDPSMLEPTDGSGEAVHPVEVRGPFMTRKDFEAAVSNHLQTQGLTEKSSTDEQFLAAQRAVQRQARARGIRGVENDNADEIAIWDASDVRSRLTQQTPARGGGSPEQTPTQGAAAPRGQSDLFPGSAPGALQVYHGTIKDFAPESIGEWSHFGTRKAARDRLDSLVDPQYRGAENGPTARVLPYEITGRRVDIGAEPEGTWKNPEQVADALLRHGYITPQEHAWAVEPRAEGRMRLNGRNADDVVQERLSELAARHDIGAISYINAIEDAGSRSYIVPNPRANARPGHTPPNGGAFPPLGAAAIAVLAKHNLHNSNGLHPRSAEVLSRYGLH